MVLSMDREIVVKKLTELFRNLNDVEIAILFGSIARGYRHPHDIDIAVKFTTEKSLLDLANLVTHIARHLGTTEDHIDVIDLDYAKPILLLKILKEGIVLKGNPETLKKLYEKASRGIEQLIEIKLWSNLDPEPKINKIVITSRVEEIRRNTEFLKREILSKNVDELEYRDILALERALHRIAEAILDICRHLTAVYSLGIVESYGEYPRKLAQAGKMPRDLAEDITKLAGLRNILVHRYLEIDLKKLHKAAQEITEKIVPKFLHWIKNIDP